MSILIWSNVIEYIEKHEPRAPQILSTLRQYGAESFGFSIHGKRATNKDKAAFRDWALERPIPLMTKEDWMSKLNEVFEKKNLTKTQQRSPRCYTLKFIECLESLGHLLVVESPEQDQTKQINDKPRKRVRPDWAISPSPGEQNSPKRKKQYTIALNMVPEAYLSCYRTKYPEVTEEECLDMIRKELNRIEKELNELSSYLGSRTKNKNRPPSKNRVVEYIRRLLGWQFLKLQDLSCVGLSFLIPIINIRVSTDEYEDFNQLLLHQAKLNYQAEEASDKVIQFLLDFFEEYGPHYSKGTKGLTIDACINVAQFLYRSITQRTRYSNFQDIVVISALRALRADLPDDPPQEKVLPITLDVLRQSLEHFKANVDYRYNEQKPKGRKKIKRIKRELHCTAHDMQRLLIASFLLLLPPLRRRTLAELTLDDTLVKGIKTQNGFIPVSQMDDPTKARYHFDMLPEAYKTGDKYGKFFLTLPNYCFQDGSRFYDYLDKFIFGGYRDALLNGQTHKTLFVRINGQLKKPDKHKGDPIAHESFSSVFNTLCEMMVGKSIRPQICRAIYRTYYVNQGASSQVLDALAYAMQHSPKTALKIYTRQTLEEKLAPLIDFHDNLFDNL